MRKKIIAGNWKMNLLPNQAGQLVSEIGSYLSAHPATNTNVIVCPPFTSLAALAQHPAVTSNAIGLGAQNCHESDSGAFTGEISAAMVAALGARYVIVGHSERRSIYLESDELVARKVRAARRHGLSPIICVGETLQERQRDQTSQVLARQLEAVRSELEADAETIIAYEPVWAIGTGLAATPSMADQTHEFIRTWLDTHVGESTRSIGILYGGSVTAANAANLLSQPHIDGALVGGASLNAEPFSEIIRSAHP